MVDNQVLFDALTSTLWQDFKGYKRDLELRSYILDVFQSLYTIIWFVIFSPLIIVISVLGEGGGILLKTCISGVGFHYLVRFPSVCRRCYDIELTSKKSKIFRTRRKQYGVIIENKYPFKEDKIYPSIILAPKYDLITREGDSSYIICRKNHYGIYNSEQKKVVVPVVYDIIQKSGKSRNLFVAKLNGVEARFNDRGDRIIRD